MTKTHTHTFLLLLLLWFHLLGSFEHQKSCVFVSEAPGVNKDKRVSQKIPRHSKRHADGDQNLTWRIGVWWHDNLPFFQNLFWIFGETTDHWGWGRRFTSEIINRLAAKYTLTFDYFTSHVNITSYVLLYITLLLDLFLQWHQKG